MVILLIQNDNIFDLFKGIQNYFHSKYHNLLNL